MKGFIINRTGTFKHVFGRTLAPNEKIDLEKLYLIYAVRMGLEEFIEHIKTKASAAKLDIEGINLLNPKIPQEIRLENELRNLNVDLKTLTPKILSEMEYNEETRLLISKLTSTRLLAYAATLAKKSNKSKFMINALEKRVKELKES